MRILVINGPNLNMLGVREPDKYGSLTLSHIEGEIAAFCRERGIEVEFFQSNSEGSIVDKIQSVYGKVDGIVINAGAYTHTSIAIRDALLAVNIPFVEVHISNVFAREEFRHISFLSDIALGVISGMGWRGYLYAVDYLGSELEDGKGKNR